MSRLSAAPKAKPARRIAAQRRSKARADGTGEAQRLLTKILRWAAANTEAIRACYFARRKGEYVLYIVPSSGRFDADLTSRSADLDIQIVRAFPRIRFRSLLVPPDEHFSAGKLIYGK